MSTIRVLGELFITFGLILLLFCAYELWGTGLYTARQQDSMRDTLRQRWEPRVISGQQSVNLDRASFRYPDILRGQSFGLVWIPALGADYRYAIVEGADPEQLKKGPGHFVGSNGTAMPGQVGNFVLSAHRTTYSAPFRQVDRLRRGDAIVIETEDMWFTYRVSGKDVVAPDAIAVTAPVPFHPRKQATKRRITLTTCHPMYTARQRLIVFGELEKAERKTGEKPDVLASSPGG